MRYPGVGCLHRAENEKNLRAFIDLGGDSFMRQARVLFAPPLLRASAGSPAGAEAFFSHG
jgi:hypothetical protein